MDLMDQFDEATASFGELPTSPLANGDCNVCFLCFLFPRRPIVELLCRESGLSVLVIVQVDNPTESFMDRANVTSPTDIRRARFRDQATEEQLSAQ